MAARTRLASIPFRVVRVQQSSERASPPAAAKSALALPQRRLGGGEVGRTEFGVDFHG